LSSTNPTGLSWRPAERIEMFYLCEVGDEVRCCAWLGGIRHESFSVTCRASPASRFSACPGAGKRKSTPDFAHARARIGISTLALFGRKRTLSNRFGCRFTQCRACRPAPPRRCLAPFTCAGSAATDFFFLNALDNRETADAHVARARFDFGRAARDFPVGRSPEKKGASTRRTTRKSVSLFTGAGPGATLSFQRGDSAVLLNRCVHRRTVASRTPNASRILGAGSTGQRQQQGARPIASPRSRELQEPERTRCSPARRTEERSRHVPTCESVPTAKSQTPRLSPGELRSSPFPESHRSRCRKTDPILLLEGVNDSAVGMINSGGLFQRQRLPNSAQRRRASEAIKGWHLSLHPAPARK